MATTNKLQKLINTKTAIKDAINQKGGNITDNDTFASYPSYILALNVGGSSSGGSYEGDGDPSNFREIGYTFFPIHLSDIIEISKEYQQNYSFDNNFVSDSNMQYFPMIEINEDIDTITFDGKTITSSGIIASKFPNLLVFPPIDFKGKTITASSYAYSPFESNTVIKQIYLNNVTMQSFYDLFDGCTELQYVNLKDIKSLYDDSRRMFYGCSNLRYVTFDNVDLSNVTNLSQMFYNCNSLKEIEGLNQLNTSNVQNIDKMIYNTSLETIDLTGLDVSSVTSLTHCEYINNTNSLIINNWNLASYNNTTSNNNLNSSNYNIIYGISRLKNINLSNWKLPVCTTFPNFNDTSNSNLELNLTNWELSKMTTLRSGIINGTTNTSSYKIKTINLEGWKLPNIATINYITRSTIEELNLANWQFGNKSISLNSLFYYPNGSLKKINLSNWDFSNFTKINFYCGFESTSTYAKEFTIVGPVSGIKVNIDLRDFPGLTVDSAMVFINGLEAVEDTKKIQLYSTVKNKLTEDQIAVATSKGWTVA